MGRWILMTVFILASKSATAQQAVPDADVLGYAEDLLYGVRTGDETGPTEEKLRKLDLNRLQQSLPDDRSRTVFWMNLYNAWYQILATREKMKFPWIFRQARIPFHGFTLSLDDIEHGILRRYRSAYKPGDAPSGTPAEIIRRLAVEKPDLRIHFALNCGARSCPPIAFYSYSGMNAELDRAMRGFLQSETIVNEKKRTVSVTRIMDWYAVDFGDTSAQLRLVSEAMGRDLSGYRLEYRGYNWAPKLGNYAQDTFRN